MKHETKTFTTYQEVGAFLDARGIKAALVPVEDSPIPMFTIDPADGSGVYGIVVEVPDKPEPAAAAV